MSHRRHSSPRGTTRRGQTIVETALVLSGILLPLTMGLLQFGILYNASATLQNISREAGRFAAVHGLETTADKDVNQADPPSIKNYIKKVCTGTSINYSDLTIKIEPDAYTKRASGEEVLVTITYPMHKKVFLGGLFKGMPLAKPQTYTSVFLVE